jgi:hypothetical protein
MPSYAGKAGCLLLLIEGSRHECSTPACRHKGSSPPDLDQIGQMKLAALRAGHVTLAQIP